MCWGRHGAHRPKIRLGAVLGYLLAGIMIGPFVFGFIHNVDDILHFSEMGVVFLMFLIGLELKPSKLWELRRSIFGVGTAQVVVTAAIMAGLLFSKILLASCGCWRARYGNVINRNGFAAHE